MERAERDALIEAAIVTAMQDEGLVDETDLLTGFTVVASFQRDDGVTRLTYWLPQRQPAHLSVGMLSLVQDQIKDDYLVD